jgi:leucyl aminopeptidase (aminopeptidase T)
MGKENKKIYEACRTLLNVCARCQKNEKILIITDPDALVIGQALWDAAEDYPNRSLIMMPTQTMHGQEPPALVAAAMLEADVIFRPTTFSLSSTDAKRKACAAGARDLNCSDYDVRMLESGGLYADFEAHGPILDKMAEAFKGNKVVITTPMGTNITANITGRVNLPQYGRSIKPGQSSSPPDIECAVGANEGTMNGVVFIDGSIPHPKLGLIQEPIRLEVRGSKIVNISGGTKAKILQDILEDYHDEKTYHIGEIGIGMNTACELTGRMLEDEGCAGTVHFGIGDDRGFNGANSCPIHLDAIFKSATLTVDDRVLIKDGKLMI